MTCQWSFSDCSEWPTLVGGTESGGGRAREGTGVCEQSLPSAQLFWDPKTALKKKTYFKNMSKYGCLGIYVYTHVAPPRFVAKLSPAAAFWFLTGQNDWKSLWNPFKIQPLKCALLNIVLLSLKAQSLNGAFFSTQILSQLNATHSITIFFLKGRFSKSQVKTRSLKRGVQGILVPLSMPPTPTPTPVTEASDLRVLKTNGDVASGLNWCPVHDVTAPPRAQDKKSTQGQMKRMGSDALWHKIFCSNPFLVPQFTTT